MSRWSHYMPREDEFVPHAPMSPMKIHDMNEQAFHRAIHESIRDARLNSNKVKYLSLTLISV